MSLNTLQIFVGVKYDNKDEAKKLGAKWDANLKKWYFTFDLVEFTKNETFHTFNFKPFKMEFIKCEMSKITNEPAYRFKDTLFTTATNRHLQYCKDIKENAVIEEDPFN
jgi:hypothetical protein